MSVQMVGLVSASAFSKMWELSMRLPGGPEGAGLVWEVMLYLKSSKKSHHSSSLSFQVVFWAVLRLVACVPTSLLLAKAR